MATAVWLVIDEQCVVPALQEAGEKLDGAVGEVVLDFVSVRRIDSSALRAIEEFASKADRKGKKVALCGVSIDIYKVLKLVKHTPRFTFAAWDRDRGATQLGSCHEEPTAK
jgi:anti-anti-sigma regulatory factor